jgi:4-amino-4-deoxy-L-arabinose transferase-like glycosyltransferase
VTVRPHTHTCDAAPRAGPLATRSRSSIDVCIAIVLALTTTTSLFATTADVGLTWDEPIYMEASQSYVEWLGQVVHSPGRALTEHEITSAWEINHEHPPTDKVWSGLVWAATRNVLDDLTAHRLGNMLLSGGLLGLLYQTVARQFGRPAGLMAAGALVGMPRFFVHAHLASLDLPAAAATVAVCFLFWHRRYRSGLASSVLLGVAYGLAMGTKITAALEIPLILFAWVLVFNRRSYLLLRLLVMLAIGLGTWLALWPWLYYDSWPRLVDYLTFMTVEHYPIEQWYLNHLYAPPPWHYPFVVTLAVLPLTTLLLAASGCISVIRKHDDLGWLLMIGAATPLLLVATGRSQLYDGERLWMPTFPFIAGLAGVGFGRLVAYIQQLQRHAGVSLSRWTAIPAVCAAVVALAPQAVQSYALYPNLLSYYSEWIGGVRGATRIGLETTYWAETYADVLPYLNANAPPGAMVWAEAHDVMLYYQLHGQLRADLRIASRHGSEGIVEGARGYTAPVSDADVLVVQQRQSGLFGDITDWMRSAPPSYELSREGVPLIRVYSRARPGA